jgi:hypothetical protein
MSDWKPIAVLAGSIFITLIAFSKAKLSKIPKHDARLHKFFRIFGPVCLLVGLAMLAFQLYFDHFKKQKRPNPAESWLISPEPVFLRSLAFQGIEPTKLSASRIAVLLSPTCQGVRFAYSWAADSLTGTMAGCRWAVYQPTLR